MKQIFLFDNAVDGFSGVVVSTFLFVGRHEDVNALPLDARLRLLPKEALKYETWRSYCRARGKDPSAIAYADLPQVPDGAFYGCGLIRRSITDPHVSVSRVGADTVVWRADE